MADLTMDGPSSGAVAPRGGWLSLYRRLLARYLAPQLGQVLGMAFFILGGIALKLINPQVLRYFLDKAQSGSQPRVLLLAAGLFIAFAVLQQAARLGAITLANAVGWTATNALRADLLYHVLRLDLPFHKRRTPGELIERVDGDVTQLANFFSMFSVNVLGDGLLVAGILALLFRENAWLGLGLLVYTAATLAALRLLQSLATPRWTAEREAGAQLYGYIEERISGAEEIRAAGAEAHAMRRLDALMRVFTQKARAAFVTASLTYNLTNLVHVLGYAAGLAVGVALYTRGQATLGTVYLITYYIGMLADPLQSIRAEVQDLQQASANLLRVQALLDLPEESAHSHFEAAENAARRSTPAADLAAHSQSYPGKIVEPLSAQSAQPASQSAMSSSSNVGTAAGTGILPTGILPTGALAVDFENVTFAYADGVAGLENGSGTVLHAVSFDVQPGRVLGILGRTGSGKSTLTRLLFRLYDPQAGAVRLGGVDLRALPLADLRRRVGMVTQEVQLFQASVRDNLAFFDETVTDAALERALRALHLWEWLQRLPRGLDTPLAGGQSLSAGEAQLLAFARVFLKDPGVVVLDEASARLDPSTEALMERAVDALFAGRTGVVIAHRLNTLRRADDILILEDGAVVEYGPRLALAADPSSRYAGLLRAGMEEALA